MGNAWPYKEQGETEGQRTCEGKVKEINQKHSGTSYWPASLVPPYQVLFYLFLKCSGLLPNGWHEYKFLPKRICFWLSISTCEGSRSNVLSPITTSTTIKFHHNISYQEPVTLKGIKCWVMGNFSEVSG